jgi:hypothetical protein
VAIELQLDITNTTDLDWQTRAPPKLLTVSKRRSKRPLRSLLLLVIPSQVLSNNLVGPSYKRLFPPLPRLGISTTHCLSVTHTCLLLCIFDVQVSDFAFVIDSQVREASGLLFIT